MMLAGTPGRPDDLLRAGNVDAASRYAAAHHHGSGPRRESQVVRALFGGDRAAWSANDPLQLLGQGRFDGLAGWFVAGSADRPARHSDAVLVPAAEAAGIDAIYRSPQGHHSFGLVASVTPSAFGRLADRITAATPGDPQKDPTR